MGTKTTDPLKLDLRKPDGQGRIVIGKEYAGENFSIEKKQNGDILLRPVVVMHKREAWLFANQNALASVKRGLEQSGAGQIVDLGSFAQHATDEDDEE